MKYILLESINITSWKNVTHLCHVFESHLNDFRVDAQYKLSAKLWTKSDPPTSCVGQLKFKMCVDKQLSSD